MADISAKVVKELRDKTGAGFMDCKKALAANDGNIETSIEWLRKKGLAGADKKAGRVASEGLVGSYIHTGGKVGVLVEVSCETDFVARTDDFQNLVKELCFQVAASGPRWLSREDVPAVVLDEKRKEFEQEALKENKPAPIA